MQTDHPDYLETNKALWNARTPHHVVSAFYNMDAFLQGASTLKGIEMNLLGDVKGKSVLHLQCHFGQDTLSLARMGAKVTGVDLSDVALQTARNLAVQLDLEARFIESDVYQLQQVLPEEFDVVFTSYGVLGWLPDMGRWAQVVAKHLKPGGYLVLAEFHPVIWMFDNDFTHVQYSYFNTETIIENETGTYTDRDAPLQLESVNWNHNLAEVLQGLLNAGLQIEVFQEFDYSPYNCFRNTVEVAPEKFQIQGMEGKLPMVYALKAKKPL